MNTPKTIGDFLTLVHETRWGGSKSEVDSVRNARRAEAFFGTTTPVREVAAPAAIGGFLKALRDQGLAPATINRTFAALSVLLRTAHEHGAIAKLPKMPREREPEPRSRVLTDEEFRAIFHALEEPFNRLAGFLHETGARVSEALNLRWEDVINEGTAVRFRDTKGGRPRTVPLTVTARSMLDRAFTRPFPLSQSAFGHAWNRARKVAGIANAHEVVPHVLRHTLASRLIRKGVSLAVVKEWLGHADFETTLRYAHMDLTALTNAAEVLS